MSGRVCAAEYKGPHVDISSGICSLLPLLEIQVDLVLPACCQRAGRPHIADGIADSFVVYLGADGIAVVIHRKILCDAKPGHFLRRVNVRAKEQGLQANLFFLFP